MMMMMKMMMMMSIIITIITIITIIIIIIIITIVIATTINDSIISNEINFLLHFANGCFFYYVSLFHSVLNLISSKPHIFSYHINTHISILIYTHIYSYILKYSYKTSYLLQGRSDRGEWGCSLPTSET